MPLVRLIAEGVGPFEQLDLDLSDGNGKPHLGPHILAGVNGSGKSTALRTIAWVLDQGRMGFQQDDWMEMLKGHRESRALLMVAVDGLPPYIAACSKIVEDPQGLTPAATDCASDRTRSWVRSVAKENCFDQSMLGECFDPQQRSVIAKLAATMSGPHRSTSRRGWPSSSNYVRLEFSATNKWGSPPGWMNCAGYSPTRALRALANPDMDQTLSDAQENCLAFDSTARNEAIQAWLLSLYSKRAIARQRNVSTEGYTRALERFESALKAIYDENIAFEVDIEPRLQPRINLKGRSLNFSQLPDGVKSTIAWVADFMMRQDLMQWDPAVGGRRPGVLLLDEADAHLHPFWQRRLLPAMRKALPDVQIIATSHSPFVISSCPESRVHVLELDREGRATARPPVDSPVGESVTTTLKEIFGVDSRFDIATERDLNEWNDLKRQEATKTLSEDGTRRLNELTQTLADRSEELSSIVAAPQAVPKNVLDSLLGNSKAKPRKRKSA